MSVTEQLPKIYQLKISLRHIRPTIWRRFQVRADIGLIKLHKILQGVMGWQNYHLYYFGVCGVEYADLDLVEEDLEMLDADRLTVQDAFPRVGDRCVYVYDFGDNWEHTLVLEKKLAPEPGERYPLCIDGARACPPEDCGGVEGYRELLAVLKNPKHEDYEDMRRWAGRRFDPERFDCKTVNRVLPRRAVIPERK